MGDCSKKKIGGDLPSDHQKPPRPVRPIATRPFHKSGASSFKPWHPSWEKHLGFVGSSSSTAANTTNLHMHNAAAAVAPTMQLVMGGNARQDVDRRFKRMMSNRASAQKYRMKNEAYLTSLKVEAKSWESKIAILGQQIEAIKDQKRSLSVEQTKLNLQIAIAERGKILKEVEFEKNKLELIRLTERQAEKLAETRARVLNMGAAIQHMSSSNLDPSGLGQYIGSSLIQANKGAGTSRMQVGIGPPTTKSKPCVDD